VKDAKQKRTLCGHGDMANTLPACMTGPVANCDSYCEVSSIYTDVLGPRSELYSPRAHIGQVLERAGARERVDNPTCRKRREGAGGPSPARRVSYFASWGMSQRRLATWRKRGEVVADIARGTKGRRR
jgi:hypothetical protein